jgi:hypothetical protein
MLSRAKTERIRRCQIVIRTTPSSSAIRPSLQFRDRHSTSLTVSASVPSFLDLRMVITPRLTRTPFLPPRKPKPLPAACRAARGGE